MADPGLGLLQDVDGALFLGVADLGDRFRRPDQVAQDRLLLDDLDVVDDVLKPRETVRERSQVGQRDRLVRLHGLQRVLERQLVQRLAALGQLHHRRVDGLVGREAEIFGDQLVADRVEQLVVDDHRAEDRPLAVNILRQQSGGRR